MKITFKELTQNEIDQQRKDELQFIQEQMEMLSPEQLGLIDELTKLGFKASNDGIYELCYRIDLTEYMMDYENVWGIFLDVNFSDGNMYTLLVNDHNGASHIIPTSTNTIYGIQQLFLLITGQELSEVTTGG
jgi:hypothetical protein